MNLIANLKKEFEIDFRKDAYIQNTFGLTPLMDYNRAKEIIEKANILVKEMGVERVYNLNMEVERLRLETLNSYLKDLEDYCKAFLKSEKK